MGAILTVSKVALKESLRNKIFVGLVIFLLFLFIFSVYISTLSLGTVARFIENSGLLGVSLVCLAVSILFGLFTLYQEKDRNELYVLLNRVPRYAYLLGRFLGTSYILAIFGFFAGLGTFVLTWFFGNTYAPEIFWGVYWALLEFTLLAGIGILFYALGMGFTLNALMVISTFVLGHSMNEAIQSFKGLGVFGSKLHFAAVKTISYIFPNLDMFDFRLAIVHSETLPAGQVLLSSLYWFFYLVALLAASSAIINRKDI
jgi:hypothetical protein